MFRVTPSQYRKNGVDTLLGRKSPLEFTALSQRQHITLEPEITLLPPMQLTGIRFPVSIENNKAAAHWQSFGRRLSEIRNPVRPVDRYCFYEAHDNCSFDALTPQAETTAFIGIAVQGNAALPDRMVLKTFPGGKYAHFTHTGGISTLMDTYRYIWGTWIPYNKVELSTGDDIECSEEQFRPEDGDSETDIYLPIL